MATYNRYFTLEGNLDIYINHLTLFSFNFDKVILIVEIIFKKKLEISTKI